MLDKKSIIVKGIRYIVYNQSDWYDQLPLSYSRDFSWSPADNKIAYWVPGRDSIPAKITIIEIPSRKEVCTKSRHDVSEVRTYVCMRACVSVCIFPPPDRLYLVDWTGLLEWDF